MISLALAVMLFFGGTIQEAIDGASPGETITIPPGTYFETIDFRGKAITVRSAQGPEITIINGKRMGSTVFFGSMETRDSILEGFTITNGSGTWQPWAHYGGGILCRFDSSPTIRDCIIEGNEVGVGGGVCAYYAAPLLDRCIIRDNRAGIDGGGVLLCGSDPEIVNCMIYNNRAFRTGGGISSWQADARVQFCTVTRNQAWTAGGLFLGMGSQGDISSSIFWDNDAAEAFDLLVDHMGFIKISFSCFWLIHFEWGAQILLGPGNLPADPYLLIDGRLSVASPCIDAAEATITAPHIDFEGDPRPIGIGRDIGADECVALPTSGGDASEHKSRIYVDRP